MIRYPSSLFLLVPMALILPTAIWGQTPSSFRPATPESVGFSSDALEELADTVRGYFEDGHMVGGELLVIKNRRTVLHEAFGWKDREDKKPMDLNTICNVRSMTKPFTGAAAQILIDEGKLSLDDPVAKYLPGFDNEKSKTITVEQLLTHRSGLPLSILTSLDEYEDLYSLANAVGERGPEFTPGSKFWYSDAGSEALGAVVEQISGVLLDEFIAERLLEPLGMNDSFYLLPGKDRDSRWDRIASSYYGSTGSWTKFWKPNGTPLYPFVLGSQSLYSTPMDYARFLAMWMDEGLSLDGQRVLSREAVERMLTPVSVLSQMGSDARMPTFFDGLWTYYGQMSVLYVASETLQGGKPQGVGHSGSDGTIAWAWPELDLMVLYFTQSRGGVSALRLEREIDRLLIHPGIEPEIPEEYQPYLGVYLANFGPHHNEEFTVLVLNGRLVLDIPSVFFFELKDPDSRGRWRFVSDNNVSVSFDRDDTGTVTGMRLYEPGHVYRLPKIQTTPVNDWRVYF